MGATMSPIETRAKPLWRQAWLQVLIGAGAAIGAVWPNLGVALKPCADAFIAQIKLSIPPLIFLVIVTGVAQVGDVLPRARISKTLAVTIQSERYNPNVVADVGSLRPGELTCLGVTA
jgi:hypothetical protein